MHKETSPSSSAEQSPAEQAHALIASMATHTQAAYPKGASLKLTRANYLLQTFGDTMSVFRVNDEGQVPVETSRELTVSRVTQPDGQVEETFSKVVGTTDHSLDIDEADVSWLYELSQEIHDHLAVE